jgi:hypothetical protein
MKEDCTGSQGLKQTAVLHKRSRMKNKKKMKKKNHAITVPLYLHDMLRGD